MCQQLVVLSAEGRIVSWASVVAVELAARAEATETMLAVGMCTKGREGAAAVLELDPT